MVCLAISCSSQKDEMEEMQMDEDPIEQINYLALGDSYTIGQGVEEMLRWPIQLSDSLAILNYDIASTDIIAKTGWTTRNLIDAMDNTEIGSYNLVSLLIGVNNQFQNIPFSTFETEFDVLLDRSIDIAGDINRVFVVSIPDYGVTPFGSSNSEDIGLELDMYNDYIASKCEEKDIPFINITEISRALGDSPNALASDNLHPSGSQYSAWTNEIIPVVKELLEK